MTSNDVPNLLGVCEFIEDCLHATAPIQEEGYPLIRTPNSTTPEPKRTPLRDRLRGADYDPSYSFLPERNPGLRQPPCPCLPLGDWWVNAIYFLGVTESNSAPALATLGGSGIPGAPGTSVVHGNDRLGQPSFQRPQGRPAPAHAAHCSSVHCETRAPHRRNA